MVLLLDKSCRRIFTNIYCCLKQILIVVLNKLKKNSKPQCFITASNVEMTSCMYTWKLSNHHFSSWTFEQWHKKDVRLTSESNLVDSYEQPGPNEHQWLFWNYFHIYNVHYFTKNIIRIGWWAILLKCTK